MAIPTKDAELVSFGQNVSTRITASPATWHLTVSDATQFSTLLNAFIAAYQANKNASDAGTRSKPLATAKDASKATFLLFARSVYGQVQADASVSDADKQLLGIVIRSAPTTRQPPAASPKLMILSVTGRVAQCQVEDRDFPDTKRKPPTADGVTILSFAGATPPPAGDPLWRLEGQTGRNQFSVQFVDDIAPGTACWITCMWYCKRGGYSPACPPLLTYLQAGPISQAA